MRSLAMRRFRSLLHFSVLALATGCATPIDRWYHAQNGQYRFNIDSQECNSIAYSNMDTSGAHDLGAGAGSGNSYAAIGGALTQMGAMSGAARNYNNCMKQRGYIPADAYDQAVAAQQSGMNAAWKKYTQSSGNKAFAVTADRQYFGYATGYKSEELAVSEALRTCQVSGYECQLWDVNGASQQ